MVKWYNELNILIELYNQINGESRSLNINLLWDELNKLDIDVGQRIEYKEINTLINENPDKLVTYFYGLFNLLSIERMKQLACQNNVEELSMTYFNNDNLQLAWRLMRSQINCSLDEYNIAIEFCKINDKKFKTNLSFGEAQLAFKHLMYLAKQWLSQKDEEPASSNIIESGFEKEVAVTIEAKTELPIQNNSPIPAEDGEFVSMLSVLQSSSKESVVNAGSFGGLRDYMHVERPIQWELEKMLKEIKSSNESSLILLCGSVGDGKSHLLAYMKEKHPDLLSDVVVHNDSTESFDPDQNSLETLEQVLAPYDEMNPAKQHTIIAINLGVLHNFYRRQREADRFRNLCDFIDNSGVFDRKRNRLIRAKRLNYLTLHEAQPYILNEDGAESPFSWIC